MKKIFYVLALFSAVILTSCDSERLTPQGDTTKLWPAGKNGSKLMGFINKSGELEIPAKYSSAYGFSCGWAHVIDESDHIFIDKSGKSGKSYDASELESSYFYYNRLLISDGDLIGMVDTDFKTVIPADYADLGYNSADGLVYFLEDGDTEYGYLTDKGEIAIPAQFTYAADFKDGMAVVVEKSGDNYKYGLIDKKGNYIIEPQKNGLFSMGEGRIGFQKASSGKCGMMDKNGVEIGGSYDNGNAFSCGLARVYKNEKYGFVDKNGEEVIGCRYARAYDFTDDVTWVKKTNDSDARWELLDKKGETLLKLKDTETPQNGFHNGLGLVYKYEDGEFSYRYIDKEGNTVYKWTPGEDEDTAPARRAAQAEDNWEERNLKSIMQTENAPLFIGKDRVLKYMK